jgi:uncharacterized protein (DUF1330 family)
MAAFVLMEFEDEGALQEFYNSKEYQSPIPIRQENAEASFLLSLNGLPQA